MSDNYNERNASGQLMTSTQRSITQLVGDISGLTGMSISTGSVPSFYPPARWAGKRADEAMRELLYWTGCRLVYDPTTQGYTFCSAATGSTIPSGGQIYYPGANAKYSQLELFSGPKMYDGKFDCKAKQINTSTGAIEDLGITELIDDPEDDRIHLAWRLWQPIDDDGSKEFLAHRGKSHVNDPLQMMYEKSRVFSGDWNIIPVHQPHMHTGHYVTETIETTGGKGFITDHPILSREGGSRNISKDAKMICAYYKRIGGEFERAKATANTGTGGGLLRIVADWIKPVESTEADVPSSEWETLLQDVCNAMVNPYKGTALNAKYTVPFATGGSGHVGGAEYELISDQYKSRILYTVASDFSPGSMGAIR